MSEYNMTHTGRELDDAINKVKNGYILPSGNKSITTNGTHDVKQFVNAVVNVPVPNGYINLSDVMMHITKSASGTFTGTGSTLDKISIAVGFKPKIFLMTNNSSIYSNSTATPYSLVGTVSVYNNDDSYLAHRTIFVLMGNSSNGYGRGGNSDGVFFRPVDNGVKGAGSSIKANSGATYNWWAWG